MTRFLTHLVLTFGVVLCFSPALSAQDNTEASLYQWQIQRLFTPDEDALERERNGFIFIYSKLKDIDIERAMDENFSRIDSMMFVNTITTDQQGEAIIDPWTGEPVMDDGC